MQLNSRHADKYPHTPEAWQELTPLDYLSDAARSLGVLTPTDSGWPSPVPSSVRPISMAGGIPDPATLPHAELLDAIRIVLEEDAPGALSYGGSLGFEGLRDALAERSAQIDRVLQGSDNFLLTNGSSAAIELVCRTFINPGDVIVAESPSFSGSLRTLRGHQARLIPAPMDEYGLLPDALERVLDELSAAGTAGKLIYTVPDFHNPTGANLSLERRYRLLELAARHRALILEDDAYAEIFFGAAPLPSLYSLAGGEGVLRAGTFSKSIATGVRVGWIQGRSDFIAACSQMRFDMGGSPLLFRMLAEYVTSGHWQAHVAEMRRLYAEKCAALFEALIDECEPYIRLRRPDGGFFLWLTCAGGLDSRAVVRAAAEEGLIGVAGQGFFLDRGDNHHIRLAFSTAEVGEMGEAARRLRRAFARVASENLPAS